MLIEFKIGFWFTLLTTIEGGDFMNCQKCQQPLQQSFRFCPYCGSQVINNSICPACQFKVEPDWVACPSCGSSLIPTVEHPESIQLDKLTYNHSNDHGHGHGYRHGQHLRNSSGKHQR